METTLNFEKVWQLFSKETHLEFKEMQRTWDHSFQEMRREFQTSQQALDRKFQETDRRFKETDKKMKALQELFEGQWGKLMESLVEGDLVRLLELRRQICAKYPNQSGIHKEPKGIYCRVRNRPRR